MHIEYYIKSTPKCQPKLKVNMETERKHVIYFILLQFQLMENGVLGHHGVLALDLVGKES